MIVVEGNSDKFSFSRLFRIEEKKKREIRKIFQGYSSIYSSRANLIFNLMK